MNQTSIVYKLTDQKSQSYGGCQWGPGVTHEANGQGNLCGSGWLHYYDSPELAVLLNPIHADFTYPILWEAERGPVVKLDRGLKGGTTRLTAIRQIPLPECTTEIRVRFAILCALEVIPNTFAPGYLNWAREWLDGTNRTGVDAAWAAADAAWAAGCLDLCDLARNAFDLAYMPPALARGAEAPDAEVAR